MPNLSPARLHRLLPSDVAEIGKSVGQPGGEASILRSFTDYLVLLKEPSAVELDDVTRIALQLASTGIWEKAPPEVFIRSIQSRVDKKVLAHLSEVLDVEPTTKSAPPHHPVFVTYPLELKSRTVSLKALAKYLAEENELSKGKVQTYIDEVLEKISVSLDRGERVRFGELGVLEKREVHAGRSVGRKVQTDWKSFAKSLVEAHHELTTKEAVAFLSSFIGNVTKHLRKGERVNLSKLGIFVIRRAGPANTAGDVQIGSEKVAIHPSDDLRKDLF